MKAGAVSINDNSMEMETDIVPNNQDILSGLGFEEGELEMFFDIADGVADSDRLIQKYLDIARGSPYNLNWGTAEIAASADYDTGIRKPNGTPYTKHDIANDTLNSFYGEISGRGGRRSKKQRTRKNKKTKKTRKNRKSRHKFRK